MSGLFIDVELTDVASKFYGFEPLKPICAGELHRSRQKLLTRQREAQPSRCPQCESLLGSDQICATCATTDHKVA